MAYLSQVLVLSWYKKECIEESCDAEELGESLDMYSQDVYKRYKDIFTACKSLTAEILTIFKALPQVSNGEKQENIKTES